MELSVTCARSFSSNRAFGVLGARLLARLQCLLGVATAGDVAKHDDRTRGLSVAVANRRCAALDGCAHTARAQERSVADEVDLIAALPHGLEQSLGPRAFVLAGNTQHTGERLREDVGYGAADDVRRRGIQVSHRILGVYDDDGVGDAREGYLVWMISRLLQFRDRRSGHR
jgi:hypothetical protein